MSAAVSRTESERPAFPRPPATVTTWNHTGTPHQETHGGHEGMTLGEWYAGQALSALIVARPGIAPEAIAAECFAIADAMVAAGAR